MSFRIPDERIPENDPWADAEFLSWAIHEQGLSARTIAFELDTEASRVRVYAERLGVVRPWRHRPTLRRLYAEESLSPDEIAARDRFDCTETTIRKWLARFDLIESDPDDITYNRLDDLESENRTSA